MSAIISPCGKYRYTLLRAWNELEAPRRVLWIMLNPSTADADEDDQTIRKCMAFSKRWGYDGLMVGNLYAWRSTSPAELLAAGRTQDIVGPEADRYLAEMLQSAELVICAWGGNAQPDRVADVRALVAQHARSAPCFLELTTGTPPQPKHPLYLPGGLAPQPFI